jgi:hypothetical protein
VYAIVLFLHSLVRWIVLATGVVAVARPVKKTAVIFVGFLDLQFLIGLLLYFVYSPYTKTPFGQAMKDRVMRFWAVEHVTAMVLAVVFAHVARVMDKKGKARASRVLLVLSLIAVVVGIPWPGLPYGRSLLTLP